MTATTGAVNGIITDSTKAAVPGVAVRIFGPSLMVPQATVSDDTGAYRFSALPPGIYSVTVAHAGFASVTRENIRVGLGFTASVDVELRVSGAMDAITVRGSPTLDLGSTEVATRFDSERLATLPGARDVYSLLANTPGVAITKVDVGGNGALTLLDYTAYGLRALTGMNRNEVEGIRVGGASGPSDTYFSDYASFTEIAIKTVGQSAAMPVPGTMAQYVSKSGGNAYRGSFYADVQDGDWQSRNIDDGQIARGLTGGPGLDVRDTNRLERFRDITFDVGGYLKKDRAWWYGAYRDTVIEQRYPWLLDTAATSAADVKTGKITYNLTPRQTLVGYLQRETFSQSSFFPSGSSQPFQTSDALPSVVFPVTIWKGEYNATLSNALYVEARAGVYSSDVQTTSKSTAVRIADTGANTVQGGSLSTERRIQRPQVNGSLSYLKSGWLGGHTFRIGGEYMDDQVDSPHHGYASACNCQSTLNNGIPRQVQIFQGTNVSRNELTTTAAYLDDAWRLGRQITVSLGLRLDRYQPGLPAQSGPHDETFAEVNPVLTFNNWGPRLGVSADLTGQGRTVLKAHYGKYWLYPGNLFPAALNPNTVGWSRTYLWTNDANGNGYWDAGEEGALSAVSGGSASTQLDPAIVNTSVHQTTAYLEQEVRPGLAIRTGLVVNAKRDPYGTINVNRPLSTYSVAVPAVDPGPDGKLGTIDDGGTVTAFELSAEALAQAPVNQTTNLANSNGDYYTWEISASRRAADWSLLGSFTHTWNREAALGTGNDFTPNAFINTTDQRDHFTTWQAKVSGTLSLPLDVLLVPVVRHQSGTPYARTFVKTLNYGNATIKGEPLSANRTDDITVVDLRTEKTVRIAGVRVMGFFDLYNLFNTNAEQTVTTSSGSAWLKPTAITGPRILRIGARLEW